MPQTVQLCLLCDRHVQARGWCPAHYQRWKKYGDPLAGPPFRRPRGSLPNQCSIVDCSRDVVARGWCDLHYRRWVNDGAPGETSLRTPGAGRHHYPSDKTLIDLMTVCGSYRQVAKIVGVTRESLRDFLGSRPVLRKQMDSRRTPRLTLEQATEKQSTMCKRASERISSPVS